MYRCCVVGVHDGQVDLSLHESCLGEVDGDIKDPEISSISDLKVGKIVRGYVKSKTDVGYFIRWANKILDNYETCITLPQAKRTCYWQSQDW